jgi:hypothetical protein
MVKLGMETAESWRSFGSRTWMVRRTSTGYRTAGGACRCSSTARRPGWWGCCSTIMGPGKWPDRIIDRTLVQRLEKHALLAEIATWPHATFTYVTGSLLSGIDVCGIRLSRNQPDQRTAGGTTASQQFTSPSAVGQRVKITGSCGVARTMEQLPDLLRRVSHLGPIDDWCSICCRLIQPSQPSYTPQGDPGYCLPSPSDE